MIDVRIVQGSGLMTSTTLAFHAEKLHEQRVWKKVERVAGWMAEHNMKATFFVYPFPAAVAGKSISERVQWLGSLGHEIAQHTHFYAGTKIAKHEKRDDLSKANVVHCIRRDFETLKEFGFSPKGFTAGSWFVNDEVLDALWNWASSMTVRLSFLGRRLRARFPITVGLGHRSTIPTAMDESFASLRPVVWANGSNGAAKRGARAISFTRSFICMIMIFCLRSEVFCSFAFSR